MVTTEDTRVPEPRVRAREIVEPRRFVELLLSRRKLERVRSSREGELALSDPQTGWLFVVDAEKLLSLTLGG